MQVPKPQGGNQNMRAMPGVQVGNQATASNFGGDKWRQLGQLAKAGQYLGHSLLDEAQIRREKEQAQEDDVFTRNAINGANKRMIDQAQVIRNQYRGQDAVKVPEEMGKLAKQVRDSINSGLRNNRQREIFARAMDHIESQVQVQAIQYRDQELQTAKENSLKTQNQLVTEQMAAGQLPEEAALRIVYDNTDIITEGQAPEVRDLARQQSARVMYTARAKALAAVSPADALTYLKRDKVAAAFPAADLKELQDKYTKAQKELSEGEEAKRHDLDAIADARTQMSENEAREKYLRDPNLSQKQADAKLETFRAVRAADSSAKVAARTGREESLRDAYAENGFDPGKIPDDLKVTKKERAELIKWGNTVRENGGKDKAYDITYVMDLDNKTPDTIREILLDDEKRAEFYEKCGGHNSEFAKDFIKVARGIKVEKRLLTDTNEGYAADRFARENQLVIGAERDAERIKGFTQLFKRLAAVRARELKLNREDDLSEEERQKIYAKLMVTGEYITSPTTHSLPLIGSYLGTEEKHFYEVLQDKEAVFDRFHPEDANIWSGKPVESPGANSVDTEEKRKGAIPQAVLDVIGHKGNVETEPVTGPDGALLYVIVSEKSDTGIRIRYFDPEGRAISKENAHALGK